VVDASPKSHPALTSVARPQFEASPLAPAFLAPAFLAPDLLAPAFLAPDLLAPAFLALDLLAPVRSSYADWRRTRVGS